MDILTKVLNKKFEQELSNFQNILISKYGTIAKQKKTLSEMSEALIQQSHKITSLDSKLTLNKKEILELHASDHEKTEIVIDLENQMSLQAKDLSEHISLLAEHKEMIAEHKKTNYEIKQRLFILEADNRFLNEEIVKVKSEEKLKGLVLENLSIEKESAEEKMYEAEKEVTDLQLKHEQQKNELLQMEDFCFQKDEELKRHVTMSKEEKGLDKELFMQEMEFEKTAHSEAITNKDMVINTLKEEVFQVKGEQKDNKGDGHIFSEDPIAFNRIISEVAEKEEIISKITMN